MKRRSAILVFFVTAVLGVLFLAGPAQATQPHGPPEGIHVHQISHLIFAFSMGILVYWLRQRNLVKEAGWRLIQYAALFFILWNLNAFAVHFLDEQVGVILVKRINFWQVQINAVNGRRSLEALYYFVKLDHLFCVPGMLFLYFGLRRLLKEARQNSSQQGQA